MNGEPSQLLLSNYSVQFPESARRIVNRFGQNSDDLVFAQLIQYEDLKARKQSRVDLERRILGGRADQDDRPVFDVGQEGVLLRLVEAVDFVNEENCASAQLRAQLSRLVHHLTDLLNARSDRAKRDEFR